MPVQNPRVLLGLIVGATFGLPRDALADRLAVLPLAGPNGQAPMVESDRLAAGLIGRGHRAIAGADLLARIASPERNAGQDWGAKVIERVARARGALTRLDRATALALAEQLRGEIQNFSGGAAGAPPLVHWALLERQLSATSGDNAAAARWLDTAIAFDPETELDPVAFPDEERTAFARRRRIVKHQVAATLTVSSLPSAAAVWVDGVERCAAPCSVTLIAGRHFVRVAAPAHAPKGAELSLNEGVTTEHRVALSPAYEGTRLEAVAVMMHDANRQSEAASALEPMAHFLEVDHVIALAPESSGNVRVIVAPPVPGRPRTGPEVPPSQIETAVMELLRPTQVETKPASETPWYGKPGTWIIGGGVLAAVAGGTFLAYQLSRHDQEPGTGTLTIRSP